MTEHRFALRWDRPFMPGGATHVTLFDGGESPLYVVASGHGGNDVEALADLAAALRERNESADAIAFVREEYKTLTLKNPTERQR